MILKFRERNTLILKLLIEEYTWNSSKIKSFGSIIKNLAYLYKKNINLVNKFCSHAIIHLKMLTKYRESAWLKEKDASWRYPPHILISSSNFIFYKSTFHLQQDSLHTLLGMNLLFYFILLIDIFFLTSTNFIMLIIKLR